ncbi:MAG: ABC transporter ATP-binding protein [Candidatus Omnitrophica bacterium]|nr:ABC transporter ATP-binding protein [Candidatus Omnitrophota bacterium]
MREHLIKAEKLTKVYKLPSEEIKAVRGVDLEVKNGDFIAVMGPSGSGKTTLLDTLGCLNRLTSGTLEVFGRDVSRVRENSLVKIRRGNMGFVFQNFLLIPSLTALENVELPLYFARQPQDRKKIIALLEKLGLGKRVNHLPKELSGGEKQRVAIARALAISPKILFADEPTGNLDTKSAQGIFNVFEELNSDGMTIIVATHNPRLGSQADQIIYLQDGNVVPKEESSLYG